MWLELAINVVFRDDLGFRAHAMNMVSRRLAALVYQRTDTRKHLHRESPSSRRPQLSSTKPQGSSSCATSRRTRAWTRVSGPSTRTVMRRTVPSTLTPNTFTRPAREWMTGGTRRTPFAPARRRIGGASLRSDRLRDRSASILSISETNV